MRDIKIANPGDELETYWPGFGTGIIKVLSKTEGRVKVDWIRVPILSGDKGRSLTRKQLGEPPSE